MSAIGTEITDFVTGDLNRDGYDDICSIDGPRGRLYWAGASRAASSADWTGSRPPASIPPPWT